MHISLYREFCENPTFLVDLSRSGFEKHSPVSLEGRKEVTTRQGSESYIENGQSQGKNAFQWPRMQIRVKKSYTGNQVGGQVKCALYGIG